VAFDVAPFPGKEEAELASSLERQIRSATDQRTAQKLASQLDYLTGDAATEAKLSLFLTSSRVGNGCQGQESWRVILRYRHLIGSAVDSRKGLAETRGTHI
jgi:hypothetical protein